MSEIKLFNPWAVLGVNRQMSDEDVRAAYITAVKSVHPDIKRPKSREVKGSEDKTRALNAAYSILKDKHTKSDFIRRMIVENRECATCSGAGAKFRGKGFTGGVPVTCTTCKGSGVVAK